MCMSVYVFRVLVGLALRKGFEGAIVFFLRE